MNNLSVLAFFTVLSILMLQINLGGSYSPAKNEFEHPHTKAIHVSQHHQNQHDWSSPLLHTRTSRIDKEAREIVHFIRRLIGVMGPMLFPLQYVLALIPFVIPAIPLSIWLESRRRESEMNQNQGESEIGTPPPLPEFVDMMDTDLPSSTSTAVPATTTGIPIQSSTTKAPTPPTVTPSATTTITTSTATTPSTTTPQPINNPSRTSPYPLRRSPYIPSPKLIQTRTRPSSTNKSPSKKPIMIRDNELSSSTATSSSVPLLEFPKVNISLLYPPPQPPPVTLFPFTLFLNSSHLGEGDYYGEYAPNNMQ